MPFAKGQSGNPKGKPKGTPNKATANAREAIARFVDGHTADLERLLGEIEATDGPQAAWRCIMDLVEYHVPKLARTEVTGKDGSPVFDKPIVFQVFKQAGADNRD